MTQQSADDGPADEAPAGPCGLLNLVGLGAMIYSEEGKVNARGQIPDEEAVIAGSLPAILDEVLGDAR